MNKRVIYKTEEGIAIIVPADCGLSIQEIARKDVPAGAPYIIVDSEIIPKDREFRNAWEADFSSPDGYGIGADAWFDEQEAKKVQE